VPRLCKFYPGIYLTTEEKSRKNLSQGKKTSVRVRKTSVRVRKTSVRVRKTSVIVLQLPTVFSTVTCCTGVQPRSNRLYRIA